MSGAKPTYLEALRERVLIFDGAMGTNIDLFNLTAADYGGERTHGNRDYLALARPDGVEVVAQPALRNNLVAAIPVEDKVARALELERRTIELDPRVSGVRVASYSDGWGSSVLVSTEGIDVASSGSHCSAATQPLAVADGEI